MCPAVDDAFATLQRLREQGKVRHVGVSNHSLARLDEARRHCPAIVANELPYNLLSRAIEWEVLPGCVERGVGVIGYMALLQGVLTDALPDARRRPAVAAPHAPLRRGEGARRAARPAAARRTATRNALGDSATCAATRAGTLSELAPRVDDRETRALTCSLVGSRTVAQLEANLRAVERPLAADVVARLDAITRPLEGAPGAELRLLREPGERPHALTSFVGVDCSRRTTRPGAYGPTVRRKRFPGPVFFESDTVNARTAPSASRTVTA